MAGPDTWCPQLVRSYRRYLHQPDAARFIAAVTECYTIGTLERLAVSDHRESRRAAVLALGWLADYRSNSVLGRALTDEDRGVRMLAEQSLQEVWRRDGSPAQRQALARIIQCNESQRFQAAEQAANDLLDAAPRFAEAWNQRAISRYHRGGFRESVSDRQRALELNRYHFEAAVGLAQCLLELGEPREAFAWYRHALQLNPDLEFVRLQLCRLKRALDEPRE